MNVGIPGYSKAVVPKNKRLSDVIWAIQLLPASPSVTK